MADRTRYPWRNEDLLREEYVEKGKTTTELGEQWDCDPTTVGRWLKKLDIGTRRNGHPRREYVWYSGCDTDGYERWQDNAPAEQG